MPLYDYQCQACGHYFETLVRVNSIPACPLCNSVSLEKQMSAPVAPGKSKAIIAANRAKAAREGHLSNYAKAEQRKLVR
jgi:putative FmdB family regulatory protein